MHWLGEPPPDPAALAAHPADFEPRLLEAGLVIDWDARVVLARGGTLHDAVSLGYPIEYVIVTDRGKTHEALFVVKAAPSLIDAALRALGLVPGLPQRFLAVEPPPTDEQIEAGVSPWIAVPAAGPLVELSVAWTDDAGRAHEAPLETLLVDVRTGDSPEDVGWVYTGSQFGPLRQGRRVEMVSLPDLNGCLAAVYLEGSGISLFERNSLDGLDDTLFTIHPERAPPRNTPVTLRFHVTERRAAPQLVAWEEPIVAGAEGAALDALLVERGLDGVALVQRGGETLLHKGYGLVSTASALPLGTGAAFPLGELSHLLALAAALSLHAEGALSFDDVLARHVRRVPDDKSRITLRDLFLDRSGLPDRIEGLDSPDRDEVLARILAAPLAEPDGGPSAAGRALLLMALEDAGEATLRGLLAERVTRPARLGGAGMQGEPRWDLARLPSGRLPSGEEPVSPALLVPDWGDLGAGAVLAPVRDLARLVEALRDGLFAPRSTLLELLRAAPGQRLPPLALVADARGEWLVASDATPGYRVEVRAALFDELLVVVAERGEAGGHVEALLGRVPVADDAASAAPPAER